MKVNRELENLMHFFGVYSSEVDGDMRSYNMYLGRLLELKLELEDALSECENEIKNIDQERKAF